MRPVVKPALRPVWRDRTTLQLGTDPAHAVVLAGVDGETRRVLALLDGTRDRQAVLRDAGARGVPLPAAERVLGLLVEAGALDDAGSLPGPLATLTRAERDRLVPDLAALSLRRRAPGAALAVLARRRGASVVLHGAGRVGALVAVHLARAGVGAVAVHDRAPLRATDLVPGGPGEQDLGRPRDAAVRDLIAATAPSTRTDAVAPGHRPDLVVLAPAAGPVDPTTATPLRAAGLPHLPLRVVEGRGVVGPLVLPGRTGCLSCQDHTRSDRDPAWPALAAQLDAAGDRDPDPGEALLSAAVAAAGALAALEHVDGGTPAATGASLELRPPDHRWRRRPWPPHPRCGCGGGPVAAVEAEAT